MELYETIVHVLIGVAIGYLLGRFHSYLREIKEELDEVDDIVKHHEEDHVGHEIVREPTKRDEDGVVHRPLATSIALAVVVLLAFWSSISSQISSNKIENTQTELRLAQADLKDAQAAIDRIGSCNQISLTALVNALNERVGYTQGRADADVKLTKSEAKFWTIVLTEPPPTPEEGRAALEKYLGLINEFVAASDAAKETGVKFPYPTEDELKACYAAANAQTEEDKNAAE